MKEHLSTLVFCRKDKNVIRDRIIYYLETKILKSNSFSYLIPDF